MNADLKCTLYLKHLKTNRLTSTMVSGSLQVWLLITVTGAWLSVWKIIHLVAIACPNTSIASTIRKSSGKIARLASLFSFPGFDGVV